MMKQHRIRYAVTAWLLLAWLTNVNAQMPRYEPQVGQTFSYGAEFVIHETLARRVEELNFNAEYHIWIRHVVRIDYQVTEVDESGWTVKYFTVPYRTIAPRDPQASQREFVERLKRDANPDTNWGFPPQFTGLQRMRERQQLSAQGTLREMEYYPGVLDICEGEIRLNAHGEVLSTEGKGNLPLCGGHIAQIPIINLPPDPTQTVHGFKRLMNMTFINNDGNEVARSKGSVISVLRPAESTEADMARFVHEVEFAGGASADQAVKMTGDGEQIFSIAHRLPFRGTLDYRCDGMTYRTATGKVTMRVAFHLLEGWRRELFDIGLLPTKDALSPPFLPRLTQQELDFVTQQLTGRGRKSNDSWKSYLQKVAPPPIDSEVNRLVSVDAAKVETIKHPNGSTSTLTSALAYAVKRWNQLRELATRIPKQWTDTSGTFHVDALLVSRDADTVTLQRLDNQQRITLPLSRLSKEDREFAMSFGVPAP